MHDVLRIIDANLNRANEGLRTLEEFARMVLNDAILTEQIKQLRHELGAAAAGFDQSALLASRDTLGDVGTTITNDSEKSRRSPMDVAAAACKRVAESLRCIEEYGKIISPPTAAQIEQLRYRLYTVEQQTLLSSPRRHALAHVRLHVLITESLCHLPWLDTCKQVIAALAVGVHPGQEVSGAMPIALQLREKSIADRELLNRARQLRDLTAAHGILLIINDRPDIARLANADGVHLGQDDIPVADARAIAGPTILIGRSTHALDQARDAMKEPIDYIAVGPMFPSRTKPADQIPGPPLLHDVLSETLLPVVAIGGITVDNLALLKSDRPYAIAVSQAIIAAKDPRRATEQFLAALRTPPVA
jgi:thiamine-phosphate pyrophosphorylase